MNLFYALHKYKISASGLSEAVLLFTNYPPMFDL